MSLGKRFNPARGLLTGVALENNDELGAGLPAEELPPVDAVTDVPAGDGADVPAVVDAPAADPAAPAADPIAVDAPVADAPVDAPVDAPAADPIADPAAAPAADVPVVVDAPAADPIVPDAGAADPIPVDAAPAADAPIVDAPAAELPAEVPAAVPAEPGAPDTSVPEIADVPTGAVETDPIQADPLEELATADTQIGEDDAGIEQSMGEVAEVSNEIQAGSDNVDELHSIADELEASQDDGGATGTAINIANIAVEHAIARMNGGMKPRNRMLPAFEAFGGLRSRASSTKLAIESLRSTAATAGERIMAFIHKCLGFLKTLLQKFTDGFGPMKQKLAAMQAAAKQNKLAQGAVKIPANIASRLKLGGKFGKAQFVKGMKSVQHLIAKIEALLGMAGKTAQTADFTKASPDGEGFPEIDTSGLAAAVKGAGGKATEAEEGTVTVTYLEALPGDATAHFTGPDGAVVGDVAYRAASSVDVNITSMSQENDTFGEVDESVTEAEFAQMSRELAAAIASADRLRAVTNGVQNALGFITKMVSNVGRSAQEGSNRIVTAAQGFASRMSNALTRSVSKSIAYIRGVLTAGLQYLSTFVSNVGEAAGNAAGAVKDAASNAAAAVASKIPGKAAA